MLCSRSRRTAPRRNHALATADTAGLDVVAPLGCLERALFSDAEQLELVSLPSCVEQPRSELPESLSLDQVDAASISTRCTSNLRLLDRARTRRDRIPHRAGHLVAGWKSLQAAPPTSAAILTASDALDRVPVGPPDDRPRHRTQLRALAVVVPRVGRCVIFGPGLGAHQAVKRASDDREAPRNVEAKIAGPEQDAAASLPAQAACDVRCRAQLYYRTASAGRGAKNHQ
jgi:hypothetical protein